MPKISLIVALDEHRGIGKNQQLLCHLPADLAFFKMQTMGKPMIMGRRTYESIGKPLPGRRSIVLSRHALQIQGVEWAADLQGALALCHADPEVMIIGGATVYEQFLPLANRVYMTLVHHHFNADVFFPALDPNAWIATLIKEYPADDKNQYDLTFTYYEKCK